MKYLHHAIYLLAFCIIVPSTGTATVIVIHAIPALQDNYIWCIEDTSSKYCLIVDPGEGAPVIDYIQKHTLTIAAILITHHHWDHTNGINMILSHHNVPVLGPHNSGIPSINQPVRAYDTINIPNINISLEIIPTPGHTLDHISYLISNMLFCGDTLFSAGCGRLFEGTAAQMLQSLESICQLPDDTNIYCGHEYTLKNLGFVQQIDPQNPHLEQRLQQCQQQRSLQLPTLPSSLAKEKAINPFLRCHTSTIQQSIAKHCQCTVSGTLDTFTRLRALKDLY